MQMMTRRSFLKSAMTIPLVAGVPLAVKAQSGERLPESAGFRTEDGKVNIRYSLDSSRGESPWGQMQLSGRGSVIYDSVRVSGNTIHFSSARLFGGGQVPYDLQSISLVIIALASNDKLLGLYEGRARLRLGNGKVIEMEAAGCFLTTACTSARGLPDDCMELQTMRAFRDGYMMSQASNGRAMIREYYRTAPAVVSAINAREDSVEIHEWMYRDLVLPSVRLIQRGSNAKALDHYAMFIQSLRDETLRSPIPGKDERLVIKGLLSGGRGWRRMNSSG